MGMVKRFYEEMANEYSDESLSRLGFSKEEINYLRECFNPKGDS